MAGEAKTDSFLLGSATVMLGPQADLMNLNDKHSLGLVKNITVKTTPGFKDLTQGVTNTLVYSVKTSNKSMVSGEMYEFTSNNLSYALGIEGTQLAPTTAKSLVATALAAPTAPALTAANLGVTTGEGSKFTVGDTVFVRINNTDQVMVRKVASITADNLTFDSGFPIAMPVGAVVEKVNVLAIGSLATQPYLACKIAGKLANGDDVVILIPKVKITSGLSVAFKTEDYDNIPLEMDIFDLIATDPHYAMFQSVGESGSPAKAALFTTN